MKHTGKKVISLVVALVMTLSCGVTAFAAEAKTDIAVAGNARLQYIGTEQQELQATGRGGNFLANLPVTYQYSIENTEIDDGHVFVTLDLSIQNGNTTYHSVVTGTPEVSSLLVGGAVYEYYSGPLRGEMIIDGVTYNIIVGFQKHSGSDGIQGDVTLQDAEYKNDPMFFTFGNVEVSEAMRAAIRNLKDQGLELREEAITTWGINAIADDDSNPDYFQEGESDTEYLTAYSDVEAVTVMVHYNEHQNRVMGSAIPHVAALEEKFVSTPFEHVAIDTLSIELVERNGTDGDFEGICHLPNGAGDGKYSVSNTVSFFASVMDVVAEVPWFGLAAGAAGVICDIIEAQSPRVTVSDEIDYVALTYDLKELYSTELDACGISVIAGMGAFSSSIKDPVALFSAHANATYVLRMRTPASGFDLLEYYDAEEVSVNCELTLT